MRFRYFGDPLFLLCCACYGVNRWLLKPLVESDFLRFWFNDLLLAPCAIPIVLWLFRSLGLRDQDAAPSWVEVFWILAVWSLLFEWIGPRFVAHATADRLDVLMYWIGGVGAWIFWRRNSPWAATPARAVS